MTREPQRLLLPAEIVEAMQAELPGVAERVVETVIREVPSYSEPFRGRMGRNIESAVAIALGGFLDMASAAPEVEAGTRIQFVSDAAYSLGRGEARSGRSMDALAAAYRVGARKAWHDLSAIAVAQGLPAGDLASFAEMVFDYIDQLSATSVSGHADELATAGRVRERHLERLADSILAGVDSDALAGLAERAGWDPPATLSAVIVPGAAVGAIRPQLDGRTLSPGTELPQLGDRSDLTVLLVPDLTGRDRARLLDLIKEREAVVGPPREWQDARASYDRALRTLELGGTGTSEDHLVSLVVTADPAALSDLRDQVLAPLAELKPASAEKLVETLRAWLVHQGRREDIAATLYVHPQTVRYRMGRLRELYGDELSDPRFIAAATVALAAWPGPATTPAPH